MYGVAGWSCFLWNLLPVTPSYRDSFHMKDLRRVSLTFDICMMWLVLLLFSFFFCLFAVVVVVVVVKLARDRCESLYLVSHDQVIFFGNNLAHDSDVNLVFQKFSTIHCDCCLFPCSECHKSSVLHFKIGFWKLNLEWQSLNPHQINWKPYSTCIYYRLKRDLKDN